jgi:hypothetical protein
MNYLVTLLGPIDRAWAQNSRFRLKKEADSSLRNVVFLIKLGRWIMSKKFVILIIHHRHKPSELL